MRILCKLSKKVIGSVPKREFISISLESASFNLEHAHFDLEGVQFSLKSAYLALKCRISFENCVLSLLVIYEVSLGKGLLHQLVVKGIFFAEKTQDVLQVSSLFCVYRLTK